MPKVKLTSEARNELNGIRTYIAEGSIPAAKKFYQEFKQKLVLLASHPLLGRSRDEVAPGLRSHPIGRYVAFYRPIEDGVVLVRVLHSSQDVDDAFDA